MLTPTRSTTMPSSTKTVNSQALIMIDHGTADNQKSTKSKYKPSARCNFIGSSLIISQCNEAGRNGFLKGF